MEFLILKFSKRFWSIGSATELTAQRFRFRCDSSLLRRRGPQPRKAMIRILDRFLTFQCWIRSDLGFYWKKFKIALKIKRCEQWPHIELSNRWSSSAVPQRAVSARGNSSSFNFDEFHCQRWLFEATFEPSTSRPPSIQWTIDLGENECILKTIRKSTRKHRENVWKINNSPCAK